MKSQYVKKSNDGVSKGHKKKPAGDMFSPVIQETLSDPKRFFKNISKKSKNLEKQRHEEKESALD